MAAAGVRNRKSETDLRESHSRYTDSRTDVESALRHFRDQRTRVQLRFPRDPAPLQASILDVDQKHLLLEDVRPRERRPLLTDGNPFSLAARTDAVYLYAEELRCVLVESERGVPFYVITLPEQVLLQQRRRATRVTLPLRIKTAGARVTLIMEKRICEGEIVDISAGGCRIRIPEDQSAWLRQGVTVDNCLLNIQRHLELESKATIRHALYDPRQGQTICGVELTQMHVTDRRRLERFVEAQQGRQAQDSSG